MSEVVQGSSGLTRVVVLIYGVLSYFIGVAGLACIVLALASLIPFGFLGVPDSLNPIVWNAMLVAVWGIVHTGMARDSFKQQLIKLVPEPAERATYVLIAGVTSIMLVGYWQMVPGTIWSVSQPVAAMLLWVVFAFGWVYLLAASFAINHFDLFGLRQVYLHYRSMPRPPIQFTKRAMYRFSRHPIQTGVLIGIWATPEMSATQIVLSVGFTGYIFIGLWFEEKDLIKDIGEPYEAYRKETGMVLPRLRKGGK